MAQCVLMVYEHLPSLKHDKGYWEKYIDFYEKFWDGPATPQSSWYGIEYEQFRISLAGEFGMDPENLKDAFFIKGEDGKYYVCPVGSSVNLNIVSCENFIPFEWLIIFSPEEKNYFYTHTGFGAVQQDAIYYRSFLVKISERLESSRRILSDFTNRNSKILKEHKELGKLQDLSQKLDNIEQWLGGFSSEAMLILNYGEICNLIEPSTYKNENSVGELKNILSLIESGNYDIADSELKMLNLKWIEISSKASDQQGHRSLQ